MVQQRHTDQFLLATKLSIPHIHAGLVARPRLFEQLQMGMQHPLTLLAAPAGFGKTVLLSAWIQQTKRLVGWVSLDSNDNDPTQFWAYVITALDKLHSGIGKTPLSLLQSAQSAPIETVLIALVNALSILQQHIALVLDDDHVIEASTIHNAMTFLLEHLPPNLHLIIASCVDPPLPLGRLRVRRHLTELRADDLRFTPEEAATFLNEVMGLSLTAHDIAALETRTERWIAGSHRYIVDYLTEEVLRQQPEAVRTFLLQTSILDRMCAPLCDVGAILLYLAAHLAIGDAVRIVLMLLGWLVIYICCHAIAHWAVGRLVGIRFRGYGVRGTDHPESYPLGLRQLMSVIPLHGNAFLRTGVQVFRDLDGVGRDYFAVDCGFLGTASYPGVVEQGWRREKTKRPQGLTTWRMPRIRGSISAISMMA